jgi:GWxTD domain-containing protein
MRKTLLFFIIFLTALFIHPEEKLTQEQKNWLEIVSPILTKTEKQVFSQLKTKEERDKFIQLFWKKRDPLPETDDNEFYRDYLERVRFSDLHFGHGSFKKGSLTERGYFYLILGPPLERHIYATSSDLWPLELWYYKGEQQFGLPPYFYLIFYQPQGIGEYRLYYPGIEGPEKLVIPSLSGQSLTRTLSLQTIKKISGELANASLSYLPGDTTFGQSSFSSNTIISSARSLAEKKFSDTYARNFLSYKDYVETDYTDTFIESHFKVKAFKTDDQFFIHWTIEPKRINFASYKGQYYSTFQLVIKIEDIQGNLVLEKDEEILLKITPEEYKKHERHLLAFQDILPIIPGKFKVFFLLKSKTAKDFTSFQAEVAVPSEQDNISLSRMILYHSKDPLEPNQKRKNKAFAFHGDQYVVNAQNNFLSQKKIGFYCQVFNMKEINGKSCLLEIFRINTDTPVQIQKKSLEEALAPDKKGIDTGFLSLASLQPGYYQAHLSILDENEKKILTEKENFILLAQTYPVIPWVYSKLHNTFPNPEQLHILASQYFMTRKFDQARYFLQQALEMKDEPKTRLLLSKTLYALGQYKNSLALIFPVYQATQNREAAKIIAVNYAGLKDWAAALVYLEKLMEQAAEISVLNLAAECYLNLDQPDKALPLLQKSLKLNPNQAKIKELEKRAKKRIGINESSELKYSY